MKYWHPFSGPWKPDRTSESKKWCGICEFGMDLTKAIGDGGRPSDLTHKTQTVSTKIMSLKNKHAAVNRRITNTLKKLDSTIEQYGRKAIIRGYVNNLQEYLKEAKDLNDELIPVIPEKEHKTPLNWYDEQLKRIQEAKLGANAHLDERAEESSNGLSSVKESLSKTSTMVRSSQVAAIWAKMISAEIKAKQLALEEQQRMEEFEKQLKVKRKLELVQDKAERLKFKAGERRKTQEAKDEAARLAAEAAIFEKVQNEDRDPEAPPNRFLDFADESLEFEQSPAVVGHLPIIPKPLTGISHEAEVNRGNVLPNNISNNSNNSQSQLLHSKSLRYQGLINQKKQCHLIIHGLGIYKNSHQL